MHNLDLLIQYEYCAEFVRYCHSLLSVLSPLKFQVALSSACHKRHLNVHVTDRRFLELTSEAVCLSFTLPVAGNSKDRYGTKIVITFSSQEMNH
jgi:hypothetical protein